MDKLPKLKRNIESISLTSLPKPPQPPTLPPLPVQNGSNHSKTEDDQVLEQGILADCGETSRSLEFKHSQSTSLSLALEQLKQQRAQAMAPLESQINQLTANLQKLNDRHAAIRTELKLIESEIKQSTDLRRQITAAIDDLDRQFEAKYQSLGGGDAVSSASGASSVSVGNGKRSAGEDTSSTSINKLKQVVDEVISSVNRLEGTIGIFYHSSLSSQLAESMANQNASSDYSKISPAQLQARHNQQLTKMSTYLNNNNASAPQTSTMISTLSSSSLIKFISAQSKCVHLLTDRIGQLNNQLGNQRHECEVMKQLGLSSNVDDILARINHTSDLIKEDRDAIVVLQNELVEAYVSAQRLIAVHGSSRINCKSFSIFSNFF